ncbi:MAG: Tm-1-like ATP-binding domain-containing protein, partial [Proteobacteria bacterium]|nr:Tm-1-like ATP-binding domain-containing protein [Pseudomonadota bacterium]
FHSVVDIAGLNPLLESVLARAAGAVCGMAAAGSGAVRLSVGGRARPRVAVTEFKFSEGCCRRAVEVLIGAGVEVLPFHAQGIGDRALEELIEEGLVDAVLDVVPAGVAEELLGGNRAAGPHRLEAAGRKGLPQVISPCGFDMLSCGPLERGDRGDSLWTERNLSARKLFVPDALRVQARTSAEEMLQVAEVVAGKLDRAQGPTVVLIPLGGWSSLSEEGMPLCDFEADAAFVGRLKERLNAGVAVREVPLPLNTSAFGELAAGELLRLMDFGAAESRAAP